MKLLYSYLRQYWKLVILALVLASINQVFSMADPYILKKIINLFANKASSFATHPKDYISGIISLLLLSMGAAMVSRIAKNFQDYFTNVITQRTGADIYQDGIRHSLLLPYQVFEDQRSGETLGILQKVRTDTQALITSFISVLFTSLVGIVVVTILAFHIHWVIAIIYFTAVPVIAFLSTALSKKIKKIQKTIVNQTTALAGSTTESLRNIELVKVLGLAKQEIKHLNDVTLKILGLELKKVRYLRSLSFVQGTTINFLRTTILFVLLYLIFRAHVSVGDFMMLYIYSFFIFGPLQELGAIIGTYREAEASLENLQKIFDKPIEAKPANPVPVQVIHDIAFQDVSFQHLTSNKPALKNISFKVSKGETIAFVGPSGSGKTTLVKLLVGLYRPFHGEVLYNGNPNETVDLEDFRERIGFVTQDTQLFSGTIRENLLFVNPTATDDECYDVLHKAACQTLLSRAEKGLDSVIGEGGVKVSGGEKQRLSIARALLRHPDLLVFDEATSSLDSITEDEISKTIRDVSVNQNHITILIAHRLSTIMHADTIFVLEKGRIIEQGPHDELLDLKGLYYAMWRQQIGEKDLQEEEAAV